MKRWKLPVSTYWLCQLAGWLSMVLIEIVNYTFFIVGRFSMVTLNLFLLYAVVGMLLTHGYRMYLRKRPVFASSVTYIWINAFFATFLISFCMTVVTEVPVMLLGNNRLSDITLIQVAGFTINWMRYVGVWVIIYYLYKMLQQNASIQQEKLQLENLAKTTELELLKSQLNPHFLFNALNSIKALVIINPEQSRDAIVKLSELLRFTLQYGKEKRILLKQELEEVTKYLELEQLRFGKRLQVTYHLDAAVNTSAVPPALLLTLVENAIKHGVAKQMGAGTVTVRTATGKPGFVLITVVNSGRFEPGPDTGIGLKHLTKRLEELYNGKATFEIAATADGVVAQLQLPAYAYTNPHC